MPKVTMIPATINPLTHLPKVAAQKRRVAGYARVSTDSDEQFTSNIAYVFSSPTNDTFRSGCLGISFFTEA